MTRALLGLTLIGLIFSCGGDVPDASSPPAPSARALDQAAWLAAVRHPEDAGAVEPEKCPSTIDARELLSRHAQAYGTEENVRAELPRTLAGYLVENEQSGTTTRWLDVDRHRFDTTIESADPQRAYPLRLSNGIDEHGAWQVGISGAFARLEANESVDDAFNAWLLRRDYLRKIPSNLSASCTLVDGHARAFIAYADEKSRGAPILGFDPATAALVSMEHTAVDGRKVKGTIDTWTPADARGVRWPLHMSPHDYIGDQIELSQNQAGLICSGGGDCLSPAPAVVTIVWPASGVVTVPMNFYESEIILKATVEGHDVISLLDSGAETTVVDSTNTLGASLPVSVALEGRGSTQSVPFGMTDLKHATIGELQIDHEPTGLVPIPALSLFGTERPEIIFGLPLFLSSAIRIDYAHKTVTFARDATAIVPKKAIAFPFDLRAGRLLATASIDGVSGKFQLDTGARGEISLTKTWADSHGFPGKSRTIDVVAQTGAGTEATRSTHLRVKNVEVGPIHILDTLSTIDAPPDQGDVAGLIGNGTLERCQSATFDVQKRTLWLEPPCTRDNPEMKMGWHIVRSDDPHVRDRPWIVGNVLAGTNAEKALIFPGDRVLEVGGKPAILDRESFEPILRGKAGTKVRIVILRGDERKTVDVVLEKILR